jgi:hypothetical protein
MIKSRVRPEGNDCSKIGGVDHDNEKLVLEPFFRAGPPARSLNSEKK